MRSTAIGSTSAPAPRSWLARGVSWFARGEAMDRVLLRDCRRCAAPLSLRAMGGRTRCPHCGLGVRFWAGCEVMFEEPEGEITERWELPTAVEALDAAWVCRRAEFLVRNGERWFPPGPKSALLLLAFVVWALSAPDQAVNDSVGHTLASGALLLISSVVFLQTVLAWRRWRCDQAEFVARRRALLIEAGLLEAPPEGVR